MKTPIWLLAAIVAFSVSVSSERPAIAQSVQPRVVQSCNVSQGYTPGLHNEFTVDVNGNLCTNAGQSPAPFSYTALGGGQYNQSATSATSLTVPAGANYARICAVGGQMNFVDSSNGTPTTGTSPAVGTPLASGSCIFEQGSTVLSAFQLINAVASTGTWTAVYFK